MLNRPTSVCRRRSWASTRQYGLCARFNHDRSLLVRFSLGSLSPNQGGHKIAYIAGSTGQYSNLHSYIRWQASRCQCARPAATRTRRILRDGSWLAGLQASLSHPRSINLFRHSRNTKPSISKTVFSCRGQIHGAALRSDHHVDWLLSGSALPGKASKNKICRCKNLQAIRLSNQQFFTASIDHHRALSLPLAGRAVFQMDKQHLRIKSFFGTSENAVKTQVWIALSVYVLVAIIKNRLKPKASLYSILQILSLTVFETTPINQLLTGCDNNMFDLIDDKQLNLFDNFPGH